MVILCNRSSVALTLPKREDRLFRLPAQSLIMYITIVKFKFHSQSGVMATVLISCNIESLTGYGYNIMFTWQNLGTANTFRIILFSVHFGRIFRQFE